jgi:hypothetical protein
MTINFVAAVQTDGHILAETQIEEEKPQTTGILLAD